MQFVDVAREAGLTTPNVWGGVDNKKYIIEAKGSGIAFFDYDQDGWLDIYLTNGSRLFTTWPEGKAPTTQLYRNNRDGTFTDVTAKSGLGRSGWQTGVCVGDYDNDGWDDLFCTFWGHNILFRNNGNGTFTDVTRHAGLWEDEVRWGSGCTWIDYDRDGFLDLFVANYLKFDPSMTPAPGDNASCQYKGEPVMCGPRGLPGEPTSCTATMATEPSQTFQKNREFSRPVLALQSRRCLTTLTTTAGQTSMLQSTPGPASCSTTITMEHLPTSPWHPAADTAMTATNKPAWAWAWATTIATAGSIFLKPIFLKTPRTFITTMEMEHLLKSRRKRALLKTLLGVKWGCGFIDYDNDGWPDIFQVDGHVYPGVDEHSNQTFLEPRVVYRNLGNRKFQDVSKEMGPGITARHSSRGCAFGDFDNDGDIDVVIQHE